MFITNQANNGVTTMNNLINLDVQENDLIKFAHSYHGKQVTWVEAEVIGFENEKVLVKTKNGTQYLLGWEHEAVFA
jgi:hypothetical protein